MKTYLITTRAYMKDYYNSEYWIDENIVGTRRIEAGSTNEAFEIFLKKIQESGIVSVSKNALKNKRPVYIDIMGNVQIGWCITGSVLFENECSKAKRKYVELWVEIEEVSIPEF